VKEEVQEVQEVKEVKEVKEVSVKEALLARTGFAGAGEGRGCLECKKGRGRGENPGGE